MLEFVSVLGDELSIEVDGAVTGAVAGAVVGAGGGSEGLGSAGAGTKMGDLHRPPIRGVLPTCLLAVGRSQGQAALRGLKSMVS